MVSCTCLCWLTSKDLKQFCADVECNQAELQKRWMIGTDGERQSGKPVLTAWPDDSDDDDFNLLKIKHGLMSRVFTNDTGDRGSNPDWVIPKTQKMVLDASLLTTQHYKVRMKGKVEQSREWSSALLYTSAW